LAFSVKTKVTGHPLAQPSAPSPPMPPRFAPRHPARRPAPPVSHADKTEKSIVKTEKILLE